METRITHPSAHSVQEDAGRDRPLILPLDLPREPQQQRSRRKRVALLVAAAVLFEERGFDAVSANEIAIRAGVSTGTFYLYFRNKRQVLLALLVRLLEGTQGRDISVLDEGFDPPAAIRHLVLEARTLDPLCYQIRRAYLELLPRDPEVAAYGEQMARLIHRQLLSIVRKSQAQGLTWPGLDVEETCRQLGMLLSWWSQTEPAPGEVPEEQQRHRLVVLADLVVHACFRDTCLVSHAEHESAFSQGKA